MKEKGNTPRRHHYVPQHYLKAFTESESEYLWVFDKDKDKVYSTGTKNAAVERDFYELISITGESDKAILEGFFSEQVEAPSISAIDKVRSGQKPSKQDKEQIAYYILSLIHRVPAGKKRLENATHKASERVLRNTHQQFEELTGIIPERLIEKQKQEAIDILEWYKENPPLESLVPDRETSRVIPVLVAMNWKFLKAPDHYHFLTCDNPVYFHRSSGLSSGEFTFPFGRHLALWGKNGINTEDCSFQRARREWVREVNRRTISNSTRFIFSSKKESWISVVMSNDRLKIREKLDG